MEDKRLINEEEAQKILNELKENNDLNFMEEMIKDNKIEFDYKEQKYKVRLLNLHEKGILNDLKMKKQVQLLKDKDVLKEKELISLYKERGFDLDEIKDKINKLEVEKKSIAFKLGESLSNKSEESILKVYRDEIRELSNEINLLLIQKNDLLSCSLENQLSNYFIKVLTYLSLEKLENNKWNKPFNSIEELEKNVDESLIEKSIYYTMLLN